MKTKLTAKTLITVGLDVHKNSIAVCWIREDSGAEEIREIPNDEKAIRQLFKMLASEGSVRACYEAGPCGFVVRRQLEAMGIECAVIAPSLIPRRPGDRIKTDRRDARKLARLFRAGELTPVRVPSSAEEIARDLLRCREKLVQDLNRDRQRVLKFLLRHGIVWRETRNWTYKHWEWLRALKLEDPTAQLVFGEYLTAVDFTFERLRLVTAEVEKLAATEPWRAQVARLVGLRGFNTLAAMVILTEIVDFRRFESPRQLMAFLGLVPGIHASGGPGKGGRSITKTGNDHVRRILVEAAWNYRHRPQLPAAIAKRAKGQSESIHSYLRKAQQRLHCRFKALTAKGRKSYVTVVAVARELVGFIWGLMLMPGDSPPAASERPVGRPQLKRAA